MSFIVCLFVVCTHKILFATIILLLLLWMHFAPFGLPSKWTHLLFQMPNDLFVGLHLSFLRMRQMCPHFPFIHLLHSFSYFHHICGSCLWFFHTDPLFSQSKASVTQSQWKVIMVGTFFLSIWLFLISIQSVVTFYGGYLDITTTRAQIKTLRDL